MNAGSFGPSGYAAEQREARLLTLLGGGSFVPNCYLNFSIASGALRVSLLTLSGQAPSAANPIIAGFHDSDASKGRPVIRRITQPTRLIIPSTATLGFSSATAGALWFVLFDDVTTQTQRLGVINCLSGLNIYPLGGWPIASSTATPASSAHVFYTDAAVASMPYVVLGRASWESGLSTAGTWDALPTRVRMHCPGGKLPGDTVQVTGNKTGDMATGTTQLPFDDTKPQNTEGDQYMMQAITPTSASNLLVLDAQAVAASSSNSQKFTLAIFQDTAEDALTAITTTQSTANLDVTLSIQDSRMQALITVATTFKARIGCNLAATTTFNGSDGARLLGGLMHSYISVKELMA